MSTELLTIGPPHALVQNTIYALPARSVFIQSTDVVETSLTTTTTAFTAVAASTTGVQTSANFVRCTSSTTCIISCKAT